MSDEPPPPPELPPAKPDALADHERAGVVSILIKTVQSDDAIKEMTEKIASLNSALATERLNRAKGVNALSIFGFDPLHKKVWTSVREVIGDHDYDAAIGIARRKVALPSTGEAVNDQVVLKAASAASTGANAEASAPIIPKISDAILAFLKDRDLSGAKVADVKGHLAKAYGIETHEKTPGMTLYRLLRDGKVRRDGRTWFYVAPSQRSVADSNLGTGPKNENEASVADATDASETAIEAQ